MPRKVAFALEFESSTQIDASPPEPWTTFVSAKARLASVRRGARFIRTVICGTDRMASLAQMCATL